HGLRLELLVDPDEVVVDVLGDHVLVALDGEGGVDRPGRAGPGHLERAARSRGVGPGAPRCPLAAERRRDADRARRQRELQKPSPRDGPTVLLSPPHRHTSSHFGRARPGGAAGCRATPGELFGLAGPIRSALKIGNVAPLNALIPGTRHLPKTATYD